MSSLLPRTLFDRIWEAHVVVPESNDHPAVLAIDLHLIHEVTSPQAFDVLRERHLDVRDPSRTFATVDHAIPTHTPRNDGSIPLMSDAANAQIQQLEQNCRDFNVRLHGAGSDQRGIVHVIGPELGLTRPGMTIVCGDSHTSTHGAFGCFAFGIGTSEVSHVLATQCLLQRRPRSMAIETSGTLGHGVTAKDLMLAIIGKIGVGGGTGHVIEYRGTAVRSLSMEGRMTLCNMSIEAGARAGMVSPDDTTFEWCARTPCRPSGRQWEATIDSWRGLATDDDAEFDRSVHLDASTVTPMITWGTNPAMAVPIGDPVPDPGDDQSKARALEYMHIEPGAATESLPVDVVFLGSCTNARLSDLRAAASIIRGRRLAQGVRMLVVPGSQEVKRRAEAEGLDDVFRRAGAEWRESGCSMCIAMNGDEVASGQYAVSTSNRNFEGRQGTGARTMLASPLTAAASAVTGRVTDPRSIMDEIGKHTV